VCHLNDDDIHVAVYNSSDFLAAGVLAEHTALDRQALVALSITTRYGQRVFVEAGLYDGRVGGKNRNEVIAHYISFNCL